MVDNAQPMTDEQAWGPPPSQGDPPPPAPQQSNDNSPHYMSDDEAWTPAPVQIAQKQSRIKDLAKSFNIFNDTYNEEVDNYRNLGLSDETKKSLQDAGIYNKYAEGEFNIGKAVTQGMVDPALQGLDAVMRSATGYIMATATTLGGRQGAATAEMAMNSPLLEEFGMEHSLAQSRTAAELQRKFTQTDLLKAKAAGALDEKTYFGGEPTPQEATAQQAAAAQLPKEPEAPRVPDIPTAARNLDQETFQQYDRLQGQQDLIRNQLNGLKETKTSDLDAQIKEIQDAKQGGYGKLQSLIARRAALVSQDTPEEAGLRMQLQHNDYAMRDLSPKVSAAYRVAQDNLPPAEETAEAAPSAPTTPKEEGAPTKPIEEQRQAIVDDMSKQLQTSGRPADEANAAAQLVAEHYQARSERFSGQRGTAQEMYERDMADVKQSNAAVSGRVLAQPEDVSRIQEQPLNIDADGNVNLRHFSNEPNIATVEPEKWGTSGQFLPSEERNRIGAAPPRSYYGMDDYQPEAGLGSHEYNTKAPADKIYDMAADKDGLREKAGDDPSRFEQLIKDAGYSGYWQNTKNGKVAALFHPQDVSRVHPATGTNILFEVAPDPNDKAMSERWNALPPAARFDVSRTVARQIVPDVLHELGVKGTFDEQIGGYEGGTNPSLSVAIDDPSKIMQVAKLLGNTLKQDSVMAVSDTPFEGSSKTGVVAIKLPKSGFADVKQVYDKLWELEEKGQKLVGGHTTEGDVMSILNYSPLSTEELATRIHDKLGEEFDVAFDERHAAFPTKKDYGYDTLQKPEGVGEGNGQPDAAQAAAYHLGRKASRLINENLGDYERRNGTEADTVGRELHQFETPEQETYAQKLGHLANLNAEIDRTHDQPDKVADLTREKNLTEKWLDQNPQELAQGTRGKIRLATDDAKATITLMKNANASTFIHETGHHWLDELMKDATHELAPDELKKDASTLRKWFGIEEGQDIPTRQHEKFARGFERYAMEGTAPSPRLAGVFAKFKQWLTQIYQTVDRLRSPINDDIRDVFDRLLAKNPEKTVIAPDHEPGAMLANIHEADARDTAPEHAADTADTIRGEIKATAKHHDEDVHEAITNAETGAGKGDTANAGGAGTAAEPAAGEAGAAEEPTKVGAGGNATAGKSGGVRTATGPDSGTAKRGAGPKPANPNEPIQPQPNFIDKAGNIRLENLTNNEDVRQVMREAAADNNDFWQARNGVWTDNDVLQLANSMGVDAREINIQKLRQISLQDGIPLAVRIKVGRQMLVQSSKDAFAAMAKAASGNEQDLMNLADVRRRHLMINETISSVTAEWGRAGRAFRDITHEEGEQAQDVTELFQRMTGMSPKQMQEMAKKGASLDTPQRVAKFIQDSTKPSFGDQILEYWINGLISGPATHTTYTLGNTLLALWRGIPETAVASGLSKIRELAGGGVARAVVSESMDRVKSILGTSGIEAADIPQKLDYLTAALEHPALTKDIRAKVMSKATEALGEGPVPKADIPGIIKRIEGAFGSQYSGIKLAETVARPKAAIQALPKAISAAGQALKTGVTTLLPGEDAAKNPFQFGRGLVEPGRVTNAPMTWNELGSQAFGAMQGMRDAFMGIGNLIAQGGVDSEPLAKLQRSPLGAIPDISIKGITIPTGTVARIPARAVAAIHSFFRTMNYSMENAADSYRIAAAEGRAGDDFTERVGQLYTNPSQDRMAAIRHEATDLTLMGQGGQFTQAMSRLTNATVDLPLLGQTKLLKFIDPFVHISSNVLEQSILERTPFGLLSSSIRADLSGLNGPVAQDFASARMIVGSALIMTIGGLAAQGMASGSGPSDPHEAAMWRLAGNQAHSIRIGDAWYDVHRLGPLGEIVSTAADLHEVAGAAAEGDISKVASLLVFSATENLMDESFMRGPSDLIKAITDRDRYGDKYIQNMLSSFTPFSVLSSQVAHSIDPYSRQARTVMDAIKAKIPYESETLFPRRDIWGEPIPNKDVLGVPGLSAVYETNISTDPVNQAFLKLSQAGYAPAQPERQINGVRLSDEQYDDYCRIAGQSSKIALDEMEKSGLFEAGLPVENQIELVRKTVEQQRKVARSIVQMQNPELIKEAYDKKVAPLRHGQPQ